MSTPNSVLTDGTLLGNSHERSRPIRVLHCLWSGEIGGAERAVFLLARQQQHDPLLAPALLFAQDRGPFWDAAQRLDCPAIALHLPHGHAIRSLSAITDAMREFDVHHFHSAEPLLMWASARCRGARRVYTHRGGFTEYPPRRRVQYEVTGFLVRRFFHAFSGNTAHGARSAARLYRLSPDRFRVTYNGLDFDSMEPTRVPSAVRAELGIRRDSFVIGTAAKLRPWKRVDRLIEAVAALPHPQVCLLVIGDGIDRRRLEALAQRLGVSSKVFFAGLRDRVGDYLAALDVFCLPSLGHESFGNAVVEAMSLGIPAIVFADGGGAVEHIEHGESGFVVSDQRELENTLSRLVSERELAERVGVRGRDSVRERYTLERSAQGYSALYAEALQTAEAVRTERRSK